MRFIAQADGVPLFVEQLTRSVIESVAGSPGSAISIDVLATLQDSLEARLDRVGPAKEVAQITEGFDTVDLKEAKALPDELV